VLRRYVRARGGVRASLEHQSSLALMPFFNTLGVIRDLKSVTGIVGGKKGKAN
jgi:hypothetical protein